VPGTRFPGGTLMGNVHRVPGLNARKDLKPTMKTFVGPPVEVPNGEIREG